MKNKTIIVSILLLICTTILTGCEDTKEDGMQVVENNGMLSYTIDGEKTDIKPSKEDGYIVNKIICDNGTDMMWDNDNWEVELTKVNSNDRCMIDFTKDVNAPGYRVTVTSNSPSSLDSLSKATTANGTIKIYSTSKIANVTGCNGVIDGHKVIINNVKSNQTCNIEIEDKTLAGIIKSAYPPKPGRTDFANIDNNIPGLYTGIDDQGTTYYFSGDGASMNNWVSFAGKKWRIIRINGNGSVRLLYAGDGTSASDMKSTYSINSSTYNHPAYVGWKYTVGGSLAADRGNGTKSGAYTKVETWYNGLSSTDKNYIDTGAIYCNDRNIGNEYSYDTNVEFNYATYDRLTANKTPSFNCSNSSDRFYNFGLMTADEIVYAGGKFATNSPKAYYYLAQDGTSSITGTSWWWTMSPFGLLNDDYAYVYGVDGSNKPGFYSGHGVHREGIIRPVISLKSNVLVTEGDGSGASPYEVSL
ncbi:MAG: hypothetical protein HFE04_01355 [Bacilli bacterium]|nr:hypothetical protein [Bacilli bacterium]